MCLKLIEMPYTLVIFIQHKVAKLQKILSGYTAVNSYKHNIDKLTVHKMFEHFSYLLNVEPNLSIVDSCDVLKSLKYFKDKFIDSEDRILSELAKLAHKVYLF